MLDQRERSTEIRRRRHKRYGQNGHVKLRRVVAGPVLNGDLFDLSLGGCLIWLDIPVRFQISDSLEIHLKAETLFLSVTGSVRYSSDGGRILGLAFLGLSLKQTVDLEEFILELEAAATLESALLCY